MRLLVVLAPILLALAGCIAPPADEPAETASAPPAPQDRIEGMTAEESKQDRDVDCGGGTPGACAERDLLVTGRIGLDALPIELITSNGGATLTAGPGDAWSFHAVVRVRAATAQEAREGLDEAWSWTHEAAGGHVLKAGPTVRVLPLDLPLLGAQAKLVSARYDVVVPEWLLVDLVARSSNGELSVDGVRAGDLDLETSNGEIEVDASVTNLRARTSNGEVHLRLDPAATGTLSISTSNGGVDLQVVEDARHGYDLSADTSNGRIDIELEDGDLQQDKTHATFKTHRYESRAVQTTVHIETSNGSVTVTG